MRLTKALRPASTDEPSEVADFGKLFDRHGQAIYKFCARRTADLALAEDLTSVTFLEAWRHRHRAPLGQAESALPWLLGVANNVVRNALRHRRRDRIALERLPPASVVPAAEDDALSRSVTEARLREALDAISALSEGERDVVMLVLWSDLAYDEAATALGIPVGTVRSRLARARPKLQIALGDTRHTILKESS